MNVPICKMLYVPINLQKPGNFQCKLNKSLMRKFEDMQKNAKSGVEQVVDVRDGNSFEGVVGDSAGENTPGKNTVIS